ncbi:hypothetical protein BC835DRAFT_826214 [Cytidiella melzeri]|nr:hypothetical protein BC835DRAFT_826214 [Cytidiella melzeri]
MPTLGMNQPGSTQSTPSRDRNPTYRSDLSSSQTASPSSLRVAHPSSSTASGPASSATSHVTVQSLLQQHASSSSPPMAALEFAVQERNTLAGQNTQLWKLIEKQRTGYAQLVKEIERVRGERDVYRGRLQFTGENTDALLRAHKESQRREGKEGSLRSAASSSHLKNSESSSSNGHVIAFYCRVDDRIGSTFRAWARPRVP